MVILIKPGDCFNGSIPPQQKENMEIEDFAEAQQIEKELVKNAQKIEKLTDNELVLQLFSIMANQIDTLTRLLVKAYDRLAMVQEPQPKSFLDSIDGKMVAQGLQALFAPKQQQNQNQNQE